MYIAVRGACSTKLSSRKERLQVAMVPFSGSCKYSCCSGVLALMFSMGLQGPKDGASNTASSGTLLCRIVEKLSMLALIEAPSSRVSKDLDMLSPILEGLHLCRPPRSLEASARHEMLRSHSHVARYMGLTDDLVTCAANGVAPHGVAPHIHHHQHRSRQGRRHPQ